MRAELRFHSIVVMGCAAQQSSGVASVRERQIGVANHGPGACLGRRILRRFSERGLGSLPVWLLPQCAGQRFCRRFPMNFAFFHEFELTERLVKWEV